MADLEKAKGLSARQLVFLYPFLNVGTMANLRAQKKGPKYFKVGRKVYYDKVDIERWLRLNPVLTTENFG